MPDNLKYPRFGGDRQLVQKGILPNRREAKLCECCAKSERATHAVRVEFGPNLHDHETMMVCGFHVGQARRFHTFEKFLAAAGG